MVDLGAADKTVTLTVSPGPRLENRLIEGKGSDGKRGLSVQLLMILTSFRLYYSWTLVGSRGRGRPRETWRRCMEREMKDVGMTWVALSKKAQDRDVWRMFVCGLYPDRGERQ